MKWFSGVAVTMLLMTISVSWRSLPSPDANAPTESREGQETHGYRPRR